MYFFVSSRKINRLTKPKTKKPLTFPLLLLWTAFAVNGLDAQTVSRFDFNSTATLLTATVGPNGTAINPNTVAPAGIAYITAGCGNPIGMELVVPGATYDLANIRVRANFRRGMTEGTGSFFRRGVFDFGFAEGRLFAYYRVADGGMGFTDYFLGTNHIVSTAAYREYEFNYDNCTGIATILDNGIVVASQATGMGRDLYWNGAPDALIGAQLDNACNATPGYDYAIIGGNTNNCLILPVEWGSFTGEMTEQGVELNWSTLLEKNNDYFILEHSADGLNFSTVVQVPAIGNSDLPTYYQTIDPSPFAGQTFYRVTQVDIDGGESKTEIIAVATERVEAVFSSYPNPSSTQRWLSFREMPEAKTQVEVYNLEGALKWSQEFATPPGEKKTEVSLDQLTAGLYLIKVSSGTFQATERMIIHE